MKKFFKILIVILLSLALISCKKDYKNEELNKFTEVDEYINKANKTEFKGYYFIDVRSKQEFSLGHRGVFINIYTLKGLKNYIKSEKIKKTNLILLMGANKSDENLKEFYDYLISQGFKNIKKYIGGYEDYSKKEGFIPQTGSGNGGCNC